MNDYEELEEVKPKCNLFTCKHFKHYSHFHRGSIKWVVAKDVNTIFEYSERDFAQVGINKKTGRWGIIEIKMCLGKIEVE